MKILMFNNGYLSASVSGGDKHMLDVARCWARTQDVTVMLPAFAAGLIPGDYKTLTYRSRVPRGVPGICTVYLARTLRALRVAWRERADVVVASAGLFDVLPAMLHRWRHGGRVAVYVFHVIPRREARHWRQVIQFAISRLAQCLGFVFIRRADAVLVCNPLVKAELVARGFDAAAVGVARIAVDVAGVREAAPIPGFDALFIGRLVWAKGVFDLVEAFADVNLRLGIVGRGEEEEALRRRIRALGLEGRVELLGPLNGLGKAAYGYLQGCRLFVFPSYEEGYGIVIAEAIAAGKPVLTYALPHYAAFFGATLLTVPVGDVEGLRHRLRAFAAGALDVAGCLRGYGDLVIYGPEEAAASDWALILSAGRGAGEARP